ncbi:MAG: imidazole glycerol phosphate synthase subunit HisH [Vampirovibrionales bacterium]|nr:imidazole glycerol phosphate synthase subunit HisH [Vampirovibrionales bacterium]
MNTLALSFDNRVDGVNAVDVIDYGGGNTGSLLRALERLGMAYQLKAGGTPEQTPSGERPVILPGVGAFGAVMAALNARQLSQPLKQLITQGTPFLGVCVGQQVLFEGSEESPDVAGLGLLKGRVFKFNTQAGLKIPQMGWNQITLRQPGHPRFARHAHGAVYFVNSYVAHPEDPEDTLYSAIYGEPFCAAVCRKNQGQNITAFQFHPEKSGALGHLLLADWFASVFEAYQAPQTMQMLGCL